MAMSDPDLARVVRAHQSSVAQIRSRVRRFITRVWSGMDNYRDADVDRFVNTVVPVVLGGQRQVAALTDAYLARVAAEVFGEEESEPAGVDTDEVTGEAVRGVPPEEVYWRAGVTVWTALAAGKPLSEAVDAGQRRATSLAMSDLQLTQMRTSHAVLSGDDRVAGYRRVLTGAENCALCTIASTQRYHRGQLSPIHPGCDCTVAPIYGDRDPGQVIDPDLLEDAHQQVEELAGEADRGGRAPDYRDIIIREHGEYGPTLTWRGQEFTGPSDL